jgi:hypothetical protein
MISSMPRRSIRLWFGTLLAVVLALPANAADLTRPLTKEEVACNSRQLDRLLARVTAGDVVLKPRQLPKTVFVTYSNQEGFYEGLVFTNQDWRLDPLIPSPPSTPERYLAFNLNPSIRTLLLNPVRPPVGQISLSREQSSSNLVAPGGFYDLTVKINPTLSAAPAPQDLLEINNFEIPAAGQPYNGFLANSTKPGRGLEHDGLLTPCHEKLTDFDLHVFAVLQRMIRVTISIIDEGQYGDSEIALFRGQEEHTYRFNVYPLGTPGIAPPQGHVAGEIRLTWTAEGKLISGTLSVFPPCAEAPDLDCSTSPGVTRIFLISPIWGGMVKWPNSLRWNEVFYGGGPAEPATYDLEALLADTRWNPPSPWQVRTPSR